MNQSSDKHDAAYRVEVDTEGCAHCAGNRTWTIVGPDGVAIGSSWGDEEFAGDVADLMNMAYDAGKESELAQVELYQVQLQDAAVRLAESQERARSNAAPQAPSSAVESGKSGQPGVTQPADAASSEFDYRRDPVNQPENIR
jgi:hypothetical protein